MTLVISVTLINLFRQKPTDDLLSDIANHLAYQLKPLHYRLTLRNGWLKVILDEIEGLCQE